MFHRTAFLIATACLAATLAPGRSHAGTALLYDATTRQVLYAEDADQPWYPASLTKLMTAYLVFEAWKEGKAAPADKITISARANSRPKMRLGLGAGKTLTFEEAMVALILHSANDIAVALAEAVAGSEEAFVEMMNAKAQRLGMSASRFINANGLPGEGQHTSARDLAKLTQALMVDFPQQAALFSAKMAPVGQRQIATHNPAVLKTPGGDGMKTGYTCSAGYNIVASATRDTTRIVAIVLGEENQRKREARMAALIEYGFGILEWKSLFPPVTLDDLPVEAFDVDQVREANLTKRLKDCKAPEAELDEQGNPICPPMEVKKMRSGRVMAVAKAIKNMKVKPLPEVCIQIALTNARNPQKAQQAAAGSAPPKQAQQQPAPQQLKQAVAATSQRPASTKPAVARPRSPAAKGEVARDFGNALQ